MQWLLGADWTNRGAGGLDHGTGPLPTCCLQVEHCIAIDLWEGPTLFGARFSGIQSFPSRPCATDGEQRPNFTAFLCSSSYDCLWTHTRLYVWRTGILSRSCGSTCFSFAVYETAFFCSFRRPGC